MKPIPWYPAPASGRRYAILGGFCLILNGNSRFRSVTFFAAVFLAGAVAASAQSTYGSMNGSVTDPSSAVIRGAKVEATDQLTKVTHTLETSADGFYRFVNLDYGTYTIAASAPGFSRTERSGVVLQAREEIQVNIRLSLASATGTTVEVTGTPVISEELTQSNSKSGDAINSLALNFRATANLRPAGGPGNGDPLHIGG